MEIDKNQLLNEVIIRRSLYQFLLRVIYYLTIGFIFLLLDFHFFEILGLK